MTYWLRDNGDGFDMAEAGSLFKPFWQIKTTKSREGFGIGLATVERIIDGTEAGYGRRVPRQGGNVLLHPWLILEADGTGRKAD